MPSSAKKNVLHVPTRPVLSDRYAPPGVYRSVKKLARRWVYYCLGRDTVLLGVIRPATHQTDAEVVQALEEMIRERHPTALLQLVNEDTLIAAEFDPPLTRPLSMPRRPVLVRP